MKMRDVGFFAARDPRHLAIAFPRPDGLQRQRRAQGDVQKEGKCRAQNRRRDASGQQHLRKQSGHFRGFSRRQTISKYATFKPRLAMMNNPSTETSTSAYTPNSASVSWRVYRGTSTTLAKLSSARPTRYCAESASMLRIAWRNPRAGSAASSRAACAAADLWVTATAAG
jgi:hypothetical protein